MRTKDKQQARSNQADALQTLQSAIVRLTDKRLSDPALPKRQELNARVEQALEAYRKYMDGLAA